MGDPMTACSDLDSNGWPQTGRKKALREIRKAWAPHLCGDQHLAVVVQHGIDNYRDGPFAFTSRQLLIRFMEDGHPLNDLAEDNPIPASLSHGPVIMRTVWATKSPCMPTPTLRRQRISKIRQMVLVWLFNKETQSVTYECWHALPMCPRETRHNSRMAGDAQDVRQ